MIGTVKFFLNEMRSTKEEKRNIKEKEEVLLEDIVEKLVLFQISNGEKINGESQDRIHIPLLNRDFYCKDKENNENKKNIKVSFEWKRADDPLLESVPHFRSFMKSSTVSFFHFY